jgi:hypothetical protein
MSDPNNQYALGIDPNNLPTLKRMLVPIPDQVIFAPASLYYTRSDGTRVGDGYMSAGWIYDIISINKLNVLLQPLEGEDYAYLYMVTEARDASFALAELSFKMYYAILWKPILSGNEGVPVARSATALQSVKLQFRLLYEMTGYL